jgi:hypothetical protein
MSAVFRTALLLSAMALAVPAWAQAPTKYDGTYAGVSLTSQNLTSGSHCTTTATAPAPLTIVNGHASLKWAGGVMESDIAANGKLVMRSATGGHFEAQINANGTVKGYYMSSCVLNRLATYSCGFVDAALDGVAMPATPAPPCARCAAP